MSPVTRIALSLRIVALVGAVCLPSPAIGQTLTLTVPFRGATSNQTASTTIEFDAATIGGGATIDITPSGGTLVNVNVPASPCAGLACVATRTASNGDDIVVTRISGTNRAQLQLTYLASFGANFCSYIGPSSAKTYTVTLSNFTFGSGFRITSFMAPSNESCDIPYARVPSQRPTLSGSLTRLGRLPLNAVLVLDKSPSMGWNIPGSTDIRWDALKAAAQLFTNVWDVIGGAPPSPATVLSEGHPEDRLGLIFFGGSSAESPLDGTNFFKSRGSSATPWGPPVATALAPNPPSFIGGTSIGAGTVNGRSRLDTVDLVTGDTAILLFTDGEQNTPPCIIHQGETTTPTTKQYPGQPPGVTYVDQCTVVANVTAPLTVNGTLLAQNLLPRGSIFTIGLGEGGTAASALLLDQIAQETAGQSRYPLTSATLTQTFIDTLVENLKGGTVSTLERAVGNLPAGTNASAPMMVEIDPSLTRAVFVLGLDGPHRVQLEIRRPDGTVVTPPLVENTADSRVAGVNLPANGPSGTWQVRIVRSIVEAAPSGAINYHLTAYGVESRLSARVTESPRISTGSPLRIVAEIGWNDGGLADLPNGAIVATIERPDENLGNLLRAPLAGDPAPAQTDASPLMVKFHRLAESAGFLGRVTPKPLQQKVELVSVGNGRYEGMFGGVSVGGHYRVRVDFDWTDSHTGRIRRIHTAERQAFVRPSITGTAVQVTRNAEARTAVIVVTPRDRFGNFVGPGFEGQFNVTVDGGPKLQVTDADVTGSYSIRLTNVGPNDNPHVRIDYGGQTLRDDLLSAIGPGGGGGGGGGAGAGQTAVWVALGATFPRGGFAGGYESGKALNFGIERAFTSTTAIEGTIGFHGFSAKNAPGDIDVTQLAVSGKWYFAQPPMLRPFLTVGIGSYAFDPGTTRFGTHVAVGLQGDIVAHWSLEGRFTFVGVTNNSPNSRYQTLQLGLRYVF